MTDTSSSTEYDINELDELQDKMVQSISHFSETCRISIKDNSFLLNLINQVSDLRVEFRKFTEESIAHNLNMLTYAKDLIVFAECCEDDGIDKDDLLELLRPLLSNSKLYRAKVKLLKNQLKRISISLHGIVNEIIEYDEKFIRGQESLSNIVYMIMYMNGNFIKGASSAVVPAAKAVVGLSLVILGSAAAVTVSTVVAESGKEQFSQYLREMNNGFYNIINIISHCESYWEDKISEIENIIEKLERFEQRIFRFITRRILAMAKKIIANSESYNDIMRQILNRDSILA